MEPATGYELSIYAATPIGFWIGVGIAFAVALLVAVLSDHHRQRFVGLFLGGLASTAVISLPVIRGYFFNGLHDSMTHVGWAREMIAGTLMPYNIIYPSIHTVAIFLSGFTGSSLYWAVLSVPILVTVGFFIFVPLTVREIVGSSTATVVGAFSAFLLLPIHQLATTLHAHPSSQAIMFAPVVIFLLIRYLRTPDQVSWNWRLSPMKLFLLVAIFAIIVYHPQQALNILILLAVTGLIQHVARRRNAAARWTGHQPLYSVTVISMIAYIAWVIRSESFYSVLVGASSSVRDYFVESSTEAGTAVDSQTGAVESISSVELLYFKMFSVSTVFILLTGIVLIVALGRYFRQSETRTDTTPLFWYLGCGLVAMVSVFLIYFIGNVGVYYFRQAGFMMVVATILGASGIAYGLKISSRSRLRRVVQVSVICGFAIMLVFSGLLFYDSPHIHRAGQHITDAKVDAYEETHQITSPETRISGVRNNPERLYSAILEDEYERPGGGVNSTEIRRLRELYDSDWYLVVSEDTYRREIDAYREYRYSRADLAAIENQPGVSLVYSNGDTELYAISPATEG